MKKKKRRQKKFKYAIISLSILGNFLPLSEFFSGNDKKKNRKIY